MKGGYSGFTPIIPFYSQYAYYDIAVGNGWKFLNSLNGEDGLDGSDGIDGSNGSNGRHSYSNTFLPITGGFVKASKGSAYVGEEIIFTLTPLSNTKVESLILNDKTYTLDQLTLGENRTYTYKTTMVENGYVVSANFSNYTPLQSISLTASSYLVKPNETVTLSSTLSPSASQANVTYEITSGNEFATLKDNILTAISDGEVKVVAKAEGISSNEITIKISTEIVDPTVPVEKTIDELLNMEFNSYENDASATNPQNIFTVKGKIDSWYNNNSNDKEYGNFYISDLNDPSKKILVYGCTKDENHLVFDNLTGKWNFTSNFGQFKENGKEIANIGDIVTLKVKLTNYKGTNQLNAILMEIEKAPISSIKLNSTKTSLKIGESAVLSVDTEPSGGDVSEVKYEIVSGTSVELKDNTIIATSLGETKIKATLGLLSSNELTINVIDDSQETNKLEYDFTTINGWSPNDSNSYETERTYTTADGHLVITNGGVNAFSDSHGYTIGSNKASKWINDVPESILKGLNLDDLTGNPNINQNYYAAIYNNFNLEISKITITADIAKGEFSKTIWNAYLLVSTDDGATYQKYNTTVNKDNGQISADLGSKITGRFAFVLESSNGKCRINLKSLTVE